MVGLCKAILTILYSISLGANAGCPSRSILSDTAYKHSLATSVGFDSMSGAFKSYNLEISDNATDGVRKKTEREWTATVATQQLIRAYECGCRYFILNDVDDNWVRWLCNPDYFYTRVDPRDLPDLLSSHSGGLERSNIVTMFATMHLWGGGIPSSARVHKPLQRSIVL